VRIKSALRHELKYLITHRQRDAILATLADYTEPDQHSAAVDAALSGTYTIASLYYDTPNYKAYWDKIEGHRNRRKVRVRVYGDHRVCAETLCYVEIKQRLNQMMAKRRVALPDATAIDLAAYPTLLTDVAPEDQAILREIAYLQTTLHLQPACVVTYQRLALNGLEPYSDLRITFDTELRGRIHDLSLLSPGTTVGQAFLPPDFCIMEIKVNQSVPHWLATVIHQQRCPARRISKYCMALQQSGVIAQRQRVMTGR
jgi:VTC domain